MQRFLPLVILCAAAGVSGVILSFVESADVQTLVTISICGDGVVQEDYEACDEGPGGNLGQYASSTSARTCAPGCETFGPYCGDDILQVRFTEQCDDGNHVDGDLCSAVCIAETAVPPTTEPSGTIPPRDAEEGTIDADVETRVVLRGKAYPGSDVSILLDGKVLGSTRADSNADFIYSSSVITPGTASFGFLAEDENGIESITTAIVFEVVQSAVTSVSNIFFPPTIQTSAAVVPPGELLTLSGQTVPEARVVTQIFTGTQETLEALADASGMWALQIDTASIPRGRHNAKSYFQESEAVRSGYGKAVSFEVGEGGAPGSLSPDINGDGKTNLVDFSIFLLSWNTTDPRADFNGDGAVNLADFSIMLFNWTG
jgi:cysteine-rich repeat protein